MALFTNLSARMISLPDGTQLIPGTPVEVSDEMAENQNFKDFVAYGDIKAGPAPTPEEMEKIQQERANKEQEMLAKAQQPQEAAKTAQPAPQPQQTQHPPVQHSTKSS